MTIDLTPAHLSAMLGFVRELRAIVDEVRLAKSPSARHDA